MVLAGSICSHERGYYVVVVVVVAVSYDKEMNMDGEGDDRKRQEVLCRRVIAGRVLVSCFLIVFYF